MGSSILRHWKRSHLRFVFLALALALALVSSERAIAQQTGRVLVEAGIQAMGGARRIDQVKAGQTNSKGTLYEGTNSADFTQETWFQRPDQYKALMHVKAGNQTLTITLVFNGDKGWVKQGNDPAREFAPKAMTEIKEEMYVTDLQRLTPLLGGGFQLTPLADIKVQGQPAAGLHVTARGHRPVDIYFDKATGLPVETVRRAVDYKDGKEYTQAKVFSDYRALDGLKTASRVTIYKDGKKYMVEEVIKAKYLPRIEASTFARP